MQLRIKELRTEKGWNQTVLGYHAGLSPSQISLIESGKRNPSAETLQGIATALGVGVGDLFPKAPSSSPKAAEDRAGEERRTFIESLTNYTKSRADHYDQKLREADQGGFFAGVAGARALIDDALEEHDQLAKLLAEDLSKLWQVEQHKFNRELVDFDAQAGQVLHPIFGILMRLDERHYELVTSEAEQREAEERRKRIRELTSRISA